MKNENGELCRKGHLSSVSRKLAMEWRNWPLKDLKRHFSSHLLPYDDDRVLNISQDL